MDLSLILATRNNRDTLAVLMDSLLTCVHPQQWEILLIDNGSGDGTRELAMSYGGRLPVKYYYEGTPGKSRALNLGVRHARGEVILFTDDDVIPARDWLINHVLVMRKYPDVNIVGGRIHVDPARIPVWVSRSFNLKGILATEHDKGELPRLYVPGDYPFGPNMSVRRKALYGHDEPWPVDIGPGTALPVGDETAFCRRIIGMEVDKVLYDPSCVVEHRPRKADRDFLWRSVKRCFIAGYTVALFALPATARDENPKSFVELVMQRLSRMRSAQEFLCVVARFSGYCWAKVLGRDQKRS